MKKFAVLPRRYRNFDLFTVTTATGSISLMSLVIPYFLEMVCNNSLNSVNTAVLSGYSQDAVVATGSVALIFSLVSILFVALSTGGSVVISNLLGADKVSEAQNACWSVTLLTVFVGLFCGGLMFLLSGTASSLMNLTGNVYDLAVTYIRVRSAEFPFFALSTVLLAVLRCYGHPRYTVIAGLSKNVLNLGFAYYAVYHAKLPALSGVNGVALGCVMSQLITFLMTVFFFKKLKLRLVRPDSVRQMLQHWGKMISIGVPACISGGSYTLSQVVTNSFAVLMGSDAVSGKIYFSNILCYAYLFSSSFGNSGSVLSGRLFGARRFDHAIRMNRAILTLTVPLNLLVSLTILLLRMQLVGFFTDNTAIFSMSLIIFILDIFIEQARAFSHVYEYSLRGMGDVTVMMAVTLTSGWLFGVGLSYLLSIPLGFGLTGCYIGLLVDESIRAGASLLRWRSRKWIPKEYRA